MKYLAIMAAAVALAATPAAVMAEPDRPARLFLGEVQLEAVLLGGGVRTGAVVARGEADIAFQQISELLPVPGIAHITPLPPELQKVTAFSAAVAATARDVELARSVIRFLASKEAAPAITKSGLEPLCGG